MPLAGTHKSLSPLARHRKHQLQKPSISSIPVVIEKSVGSPNLEDLKHSLYYVPDDKTFEDFMFAVIKDFRVLPRAPLFFFVHGKVLPGEYSIKRVWEEMRDRDGAVYVVYAQAVGEWEGKWRVV